MQVNPIASARRDAPLTLADFEFPLPAELIAQEPAAERDAARLLVLDRASSELAHSHVHSLSQWLRADDLLIVNDTRVMPARLCGQGPAGGAVELLLVRPHDTESATAPSPGTQPAATESTVWLCMGKPAKRLRPRARLHFGDITARIVQALGDGSYLVELPAADKLHDFIVAHGEIPLPPYIQRPDGPLPFDRERYQTVFARKMGAVAAPTAGLHFTHELVGKLTAAGIAIAHLTLHVGPGTFRPIRSADPTQHVMDPEWYEIPEATVAAMRRTRAAGGRVIAVGTTTTRALEASVDDAGEPHSGSGWATCYIRPGHRFRAIDCLFTNFHLPGSTLLLLVSALAGRTRILATYEEAIRQRYRFYSYGDAMLIL